MSKENTKTNTLTSSQKTTHKTGSAAQHATKDQKTSSQKTTHKAKQCGAARDERSEDLKSEDHAHNISRPLPGPSKSEPKIVS